MILNELAQQERALVNMATERVAAIAFVQNQTSTGSAELRSLSAFLLGTSVRAATLRDSIVRIKKIAEEQRRRVSLAQRNERLLLKLKEKKLAIWQAQTDRELQVVAQEAWTAVRSVLDHASSFDSDSTLPE
jgi:hypothetical protein